jgi:hypothetical protein
MDRILDVPAQTATLGAENQLGNRANDPLSKGQPGNKGIARCCPVTRLIRRNCARLTVSTPPGGAPPLS